MARRSKSSAVSILTRAYQRQLQALTRATVQSTRSAGKVVQKATQKAVKKAADDARPPPGPGDWLPNLALGPAGGRRFFLHRPPGVPTLPGAFGLPGGRPPLVVMLHGCGQTAREFAIGTRMNRLAAKHGFLVLYPQQDRLAHAQGCWNWFDGRNGRALAEARTLMAAIDQACKLYGADPTRVVLAGLSAGAGMAALMASQWPERFAAVAMHSGVGPGAAQSAASALLAMQGGRGVHLPATLAADLPPLLVLQGDGDRVVDARNAEAVAALWAQAAGAVARPPELRQRGKRLPMLWQDWRRGRTVQVRCITVQGLGHAWSGGAARGNYTDPRGPDATALVWAFAAQAFAAAEKLLPAARRA